MSILVRLTSNHRKGDFSIGSTSEILNFSITAALASSLFAAGSPHWYRPDEVSHAF
jgi:hypothetical protein